MTKKLEKIFERIHEKRKKNKLFSYEKITNYDDFYDVREDERWDYMNR